MEKLEQWQKSGRPFYVSITGLRPKSLWYYFHFFWHAIPSKNQAEKASGILLVRVKMINGIQHTLTVWESQNHMQKYIRQGAHLAALKAFKKIATGKTIGFEAHSIPTWPEAHEIWREKGKDHSQER